MDKILLTVHCRLCPTMDSLVRRWDRTTLSWFRIAKKKGGKKKKKKKKMKMKGFSDYSFMLPQEIPFPLKL